MTEFEMVVWASAYGARWEQVMHIVGMKEAQAASEAFESATYAVQELRRFKIEPVFGYACGASSEIEKAVLEEVGPDPDEEENRGI